MALLTEVGHHAEIRGGAESLGRVLEEVANAVEGHGEDVGAVRAADLQHPARRGNAAVAGERAVMILVCRDAMGNALTVGGAVESVDITFEDGTLSLSKDVRITGSLNVSQFVDTQTVLFVVEMAVPQKA